MILAVSVALFMLGAIVASFVGVVVARLYTGESFVTGRSRCDACGSALTSWALVPILSYVFGGGRARCCSARVSPLSPLTELLLGSLFVLSYEAIGFSWALPLMLLSLAALLALVLYDLAHQILPTPLLIIFIGASAATGLILAPSLTAFLDSLSVAALLALVLATIHFFSKGRAMGLADTPFVFGLSLLVGPAAFSGFVFSFWIGAVIGIVLLLQRPHGSRMGVEVPFAPFLAAGFLLAYFTQWNPFTLIEALLS